ncbi:Signal peptidase 18 kDa subunit [Spraguea lophii 42_110]|uniref:Signal peptidase complex catalytic subunit SEC11 n=1 Tax=Spraguea lophii (strain 42_110) TaxID=1358809 RepID=S7W9K6_SPRLO|nr:Signal peptidase 18 kDa subunit [Spraguea lophii 42_110]
MLSMFLSSSDIQALKRMGIRQILTQIVNASYSIISSYMMWKFVGVLLNNDSPIVVVISGSMEPGYHRGDILILSTKPKYEVGDVSVFRFNRDEIAIVHRTIKNFGKNRTLTKGDNNLGDDVPLYRRGQQFLYDKDLISTVVGFIPYCGMITIWINEIPYLREMILFCISLSVFLTRK